MLPTFHLGDHFNNGPYILVNIVSLSFSGLGTASTFTAWQEYRSKTCQSPRGQRTCPQSICRRTWSINSWEWNQRLLRTELWQGIKEGQEERIKKNHISCPSVKGHILIFTFRDGLKLLKIYTLTKLTSLCCCPLAMRVVSK